MPYPSDPIGSYFPRFDNVVNFRKLLEEVPNAVDSSIEEDGYPTIRARNLVIWVCGKNDCFCGEYFGDHRYISIDYGLANPYQPVGVVLTDSIKFAVEFVSFFQNHEICSAEESRPLSVVK